MESFEYSESSRGMARDHEEKPSGPLLTSPSPTAVVSDGPPSSNHLALSPSNSAAAASQRHARMTSVIEPLLARGGGSMEEGPSTPQLGRKGTMGSIGSAMGGGPPTPLGTMMAHPAVAHVNQVAVTLDALNDHVRAMLTEFSALVSSDDGDFAGKNGLGTEDGGNDGPSVDGRQGQPEQQGRTCARCETLDVRLRTMQDSIAFHRSTVEASLRAHAQAVSNSVVHLAAMSSSSRSSSIATVSSQHVLSCSNSIGFIPPLPQGPQQGTTTSLGYVLGARGSFYYQRNNDAVVDPNMASSYSVDDAAAGSYSGELSEQISPMAAFGRQTQQDGGAMMTQFAPVAPPPSGAVSSPPRHRHRRQQQVGRSPPRLSHPNNNAVTREDIHLPFQGRAMHHLHNSTSSLCPSDAYGGHVPNESNPTGGNGNGPLGGCPAAQLAIKVVNDSVVIPFLRHRSPSLSIGDPVTTDSSMSLADAATILGGNDIDAFLRTAQPTEHLFATCAVGKPSPSPDENSAGARPRRQTVPPPNEEDRNVRVGWLSERVSNASSNDNEDARVAAQQVRLEQPAGTDTPSCVAAAGITARCGASSEPRPPSDDVTPQRSPQTQSGRTSVAAVTEGGEDIGGGGARRHYMAPRVGTSFVVHQVPSSAAAADGAFALSMLGASTSLQSSLHRTQAPHHDGGHVSSARPSTVGTLDPTARDEFSNSSSSTARHAVARHSVYAGVQLRNTFKLP